MKSLIIDPQVIQLAQKNQQQFRQTYQKINRLKQEAGKEIQDDARNNVQLSLMKLQRAIYFRDQSKDFKKVVQLCLIFIKQAFINNKREPNDPQYESIKSYIQKNIRYLAQHQQINASICLISLYRRLDKKEDIKQNTQELLRILLRSSPSVDERQRVRALILQVYQQLLTYNDPKSDIWSSYLRYEFCQQSPNYLQLIQVLLRHFPQSYMIVPLYLLLDRYESAKKLVQYFGITSNSNKKMMQLLERIINLSEKHNLNGLKNLYDSQIRSLKLSNFNTVMKALLKKMQKPYIKVQHQSYQ